MSEYLAGLDLISQGIHVPFETPITLDVSLVKDAGIDGDDGPSVESIQALLQLVESPKAADLWC